MEHYTSDVCAAWLCPDGITWCESTSCSCAKYQSSPSSRPSNSGTSSSSRITPGNNLNTTINNLNTINAIGNAIGNLLDSSSAAERPQRQIGPTAHGWKTLTPQQGRAYRNCIDQGRHDDWQRLDICYEAAINNRLPDVVDNSESESTDPLRFKPGRDAKVNSSEYSLWQNCINRHQINNNDERQQISAKCDDEAKNQMASLNSLVMPPNQS